MLLRELCYFGREAEKIEEAVFFRLTVVPGAVKMSKTIYAANNEYNVPHGRMFLAYGRVL